MPAHLLTTLAGTATRRDVLRALHRHSILVELRYLADLCRDGPPPPPPVTHGKRIAA